MQLKANKSKHHKVLIIGAGSSALTLAAKLVREGEKDIGIYTKAHGASPLIAGINFLTEDTREERELYVKDMMEVGYELNQRSHVEKMVNESYETLKFMEELGVEFSNKDGLYNKRHLSGHSKPRTLYSSEEFIGTTILRKEREYLEENNINIKRRYECIDIEEEAGVRKAIFLKDNEITEVYADVIVMAWGGAGDLLGDSTYPKDIYGNTLTIANKLGLELIDLEFIEFEPMVLLHPEGVKGEPCPTAMLGEGANLLNSKEERFLLEVLEKEAGAPKSIINAEIQKQVDIGNGSEYNGVWADLRHIPTDTLKGYPWFYNLLMKHGVDPNQELLNVGPIKHSLSGGIKVDVNYKVRDGIYAVGEAAGGIHGACRCAGNGGAQAVISGYIAAKAILQDKSRVESRIDEESPREYKVDQVYFRKYKERLGKIGNEKYQYIKTEEGLKEFINELESMLTDKEIEKDRRIIQSIEAIKLIIKSSMARNESVGSFVIK